MKPSQVFSSVLIMITMTCVTTAQTLQFFPSAVAPAITHSFFSGAGTDTQRFGFTNSSEQLSDNNMIQVTVSAPPGQAWHVTSPSHGLAQQDFPHLELNLSFSIPGQAMGTPFAQITSTSMDFNFVLGGPALVGSPTFFSLVSGNSFSIQGTANINGNFAFTSLTLIVHFDNSLLAAAPLEPFFQSQLAYSYPGLSSDPGPQLTLIPVPVPTPLLWQTVRFQDASEALVFSWTNSNFLLQAGPTATGLFTNLPGATSPYAVSTKGLPLFFRLEAN